jgi:hypothetical protein
VGFVRNGGNGFAEGREASAASAEIFGAHSAAGRTTQPLEQFEIVAFSSAFSTRLQLGHGRFP